MLPDGEAEAPSGKRSGKDRAAGAAGALHNSCRGAQPGMKKSGAAREGARQLPGYEAGCESGAQDLEHGNPGAQSGERKSGP